VLRSLHFGTLLAAMQGEPKPRDIEELDEASEN